MSIEDFLVFLYSQNETEIYYFLLNQAEITCFNNTKLEIAVIDVKQNLLSQISKLLFTWTGKQWNVIISRQSEILTLKDQLTNKVKSAREWQLITSHFSSADITDILLSSLKH